MGDYSYACRLFSRGMIFARSNILEEKWRTTRRLQPAFIKIKFHRLVASQRGVVGWGGVVGGNGRFVFSLG